MGGGGGLPRGGWRGGVPVARPNFSLGEREPLPRRYATEIAILIGPEKDIPAPDMGTNPQVMAWIMDTVSMHAGHSVTASVTGKPTDVGGSEGRQDAAGRGVTVPIPQCANDAPGCEPTAHASR